MDRKKMAKYGILLLTIVVGFAFLTHLLKGGETLDEYALAHPDEQIETTSDETSKEESDESQASIMAEETTSQDTDESAANETKETNEEYTEAYVEKYAVSLEDAVVYESGFFYGAIPQIVKDKMKGVSYPLDIDETKICYDDLRYVSVLYKDFEGNTCTGELICNKAIADDMVEVFSELYKADYRIDKMRLIDEYDADDTASMSDDNTSCFCYRVVDGTAKLSKHAYGLAIDINPFYNPYVEYKQGGDDYISPAGSEQYADRNNNFPYKIDENDLAYKLFTQKGYTWGGNWNSCKDYQHFQKSLD